MWYGLNFLDNWLLIRPENLEASPVFYLQN